MNEPEIKELKEKNVAFVSFVGNYMGNSQVFKDLFEKLCAWAGPKGLINEGAVFLSAYYDDPQVTPPEELRLDVCITVPEGTEVEGDVKTKVLAGGKYVVMGAELKDKEEFKPAWMKVMEYMKEKNLEVDLTRASYELYKNNPEEHPEKLHILDICMAVK